MVSLDLVRLRAQWSGGRFYLLFSNCDGRSKCKHRTIAMPILGTGKVILKQKLLLSRLLTLLEYERVGKILLQ